MTDPYRILGEVLPEPPKPKPKLTPNEVEGIYAGRIFSLIGILIFLGTIAIVDVSTAHKAYEQVDVVLMKKRRANTCGFKDIDRGFEIVSYDGGGHERSEGYFDTRQAADEFKAQSKVCKGIR